MKFQKIGKLIFLEKLFLDESFDRLYQSELHDWRYNWNRMWKRLGYVVRQVTRIRYGDETSDSAATLYHKYAHSLQWSCMMMMVVRLGRGSSGSRKDPSLLPYDAYLSTSLWVSGGMGKSHTIHSCYVLLFLLHRLGYRMWKSPRSSGHPYYVYTGSPTHTQSLTHTNSTRTHTFINLCIS